MNESNQFQNAFNNSGFGGHGVNGWSSTGPIQSPPSDAAYRALLLQVEAQGRESASLQTLLIETRKKLDEVEKQYKDVDDKLKKADKKLESLGNNISQVRNKTLEPLAIFVGLFTFVSIGFQTFANVKDPMLWPAILAIVLGGIVILAGLILHASSIAKDAAERRIYTGLIVLVGLIIGLTGVGAYGFAIRSVEASYSKDCLVALSYKFNLEETRTMCKEN